LVPLSLLCANVFRDNILLIFVLIILLAFSAFFSSSETAFSTSNVIRIRNFADEKVKGARKALYICENYDKTLTSILVGNNLVNIAATTIGAYVFACLVKNPTLANVLNTVVLTILVLIFGEILPKSLAKVNPEKLALRYSNIMYVIIWILYPITFLFLRLQNRFVKRAKKNSEIMPTVTEDELESIIDTMEEEGVIDSDDAELIQGVLDLDDKVAYDIMTPRIDISAIELKEDNENILNLFIDTNYSRIPVYSEDIDHIIGILNFKDFYREYNKNPKIDITKIMTEPLYINENVGVDDIIRSMQRVKKHMAVVLDEHGGTSGIVCLEDAIEEMVGEIYDEHDEVKNQSMFVKVEEKEFLVDAEIEIKDLFERLDIERMPETDYNNLAGFLYELSETVPKQDQILKYTTIDERVDKDGNYVEKVIHLIFTLQCVEDKRIKQVLIKIDDEVGQDKESSK